MLGAALALLLSGGAQAKPRTTAATLLDRIQIEDLIIDYYAQFGGDRPATFGDEYTDDGELVLGTRVIKGKEAIKAMYAGIRAPAGAAPARPRPRMNVLVNNPNITVTGNTAHGEFIYTGVIAVAPDKAPEVHEQGREIDDFVKVNGEWKIKRRQVINDANPGFATPQPAASKPAG
jgi:hypothetical protein